MGVMELIGVLGGFEGIKWLITFWVHRKQEKRLKESQAKKAENEADQSKVATENAMRDMYEETLARMRELDEKRITEMREDYNARIADLNKANAELHNQNLELLKAGARKDDIIADKVAKLREIQELRVEDARKIGELDKALQYYKSWKCIREYGKGGKKCDRREPQQKPPLKYDPKEEPDYDAG